MDRQDRMTSHGTVTLEAITYEAELSVGGFGFHVRYAAPHLVLHAGRGARIPDFDRLIRIGLTLVTLLALTIRRRR